jgi:hypothetical protein
MAAALGLNPVGVVPVHTPSATNVQCPVYAVRLIIPNGVTVDDIAVIEMPLEGQNIECLIGRDVLSQAVLVYVGYANMFTMSF